MCLPASLPSHGLYPLLPCHMPCSAPHGLAELAACLSQPVLKWELCLMFLFVRQDWVRPDLKSIPNPLVEAAQGGRAGQPGLQTPEMAQPWFSNSTFPPYTLGWGTAGTCISLFPPFSTWVANVCTLFSLILGARAKVVLLPLYYQAERLQVTKGKVYVSNRWGEGRTPLRGQKWCASFYLLIY